MCSLKQLLLLLLSLGLFGCDSAQTPSKELRIFADSFRDANHAKTADAMLELYELDGSTQQTIDLLRNALLYELGLEIESIDFEPLRGSPEELIHYSHLGVEYGPTLQPSHRMRVRYATDDRFESLFTIGRNSKGRYKIVSSRPIENGQKEGLGTTDNP